VELRVDVGEVYSLNVLSGPLYKVGMHSTGTGTGTDVDKS
jgi:hypothetical protein